MNRIEYQKTIYNKWINLKTGKEVKMATTKKTTKKKTTKRKVKKVVKTKKTKRSK